MLLELRGEDASYAGHGVLKGINLDLRRGERMVVMGRSGAGKSTLLGVLYRKLAQQAALVPQAAFLVGTLSVFHNVYMGRLDRHSALRNLAMLVRPCGAVLTEVAAVLAEVGLADKLHARAGELSGGQQQRASIARALYNGRPVVIGDEPVSALDHTQGAAVLRRMTERHETIILALHDVKLALAFAQRIVVLEAGRIALDAPAASLSADDLMRFYD